MATTLGSTGITFPDATTQATAATGGVTSLNGQTGAITNTSLYAIGSYINGRPLNNTNYAVNATIAGSSLYSLPTGTWWSNSWGSFTYITTTASPTASLINTGTWRCVSSAQSQSNGASIGLWVRIS
jgi:hypothetical protein